MIFFTIWKIILAEWQNNCQICTKYYDTLTFLLPNLSQIFPHRVELINIPINTTVVIRASCHLSRFQTHLNSGDRILNNIISVASAIWKMRGGNQIKNRVFFALDDTILNIIRIMSGI